MFLLNRLLSTAKRGINSEQERKNMKFDLFTCTRSKIGLWFHLLAYEVSLSTLHFVRECAMHRSVFVSLYWLFGFSAPLWVIGRAIKFRLHLSRSDKPRPEINSRKEMISMVYEQMKIGRSEQAPWAESVFSHVENIIFQNRVYVIKYVHTLIFSDRKWMNIQNCATV